MKSTPEQLIEIRPAWEAFREIYPGKTAKTPDWKNLVYRQDHPKRGVGEKFKAHEIIPLLIPAIDYQKKARAWEAKQPDIFVPSWKNLQTWITNMCWEEEHPEYDESEEAQAETTELGTKQVTESEARKFW